MLTVSTIIPTFNRADLLREAVISVLEQTRPPNEIIIWNDGSTDHTREVANSLSQQTPIPIRYFEGENGGKSQALNHALQHAQGEAIWICDDDDLCCPKALLHLSEMIEKTGYPVAGGFYERFGHDPETGATIASDPGYKPDLTQGSLLRHLLEDIFLFQNATLVLAKAYHDVGGFDETMPRSIDYEMILRLASRYPIAYIDKVLFRQRHHTGARGPVSARHSAEKVTQIWRAQNANMFLKLRAELPLSLYLEMFDTPNPQTAQRAALLQRGTVMARHGLWQEALSDFEHAVNISGTTDFSQVEYEICLRAMQGKDSFPSAASPDLLELYRQLRTVNVTGRTVAQSLAQGARWQLRRALVSGDFIHTHEVFQMMMSMAGHRGFIKWSAVFPKTVIERKTPPSITHHWREQTD